GRFREFWQCDFDIIGTRANAADIEIALVIYDLMRALGFERFQIHVNNRLLLNGLLEELGFAGHTATVLRALDKLPKIGQEGVVSEIVEKVGVSLTEAEQVPALVQTRGCNADVLGRLEREFGQNPKATEGIGCLRELLEVARAAGVDESYLRL